MTEMLISVCLSATGAECHEFSLLFDGAEMSLLTCMMRGQTIVADWQQHHPGWQVKRWSCRQHETRELAL